MAPDEQKGHILKIVVLDQVIERVVSVLDTAFHPVSGTLVSPIVLCYALLHGARKHTCK